MRKALFTICLTLLLSVAIHAQNVAPPIYEQNAYSLRNGDVFYYDELLEHAHYPTFRILGHGYAKDRDNVYYRGEILRHVDPYSFRLKDYADYPSPGTGYDPHPKDYYKTRNAVCYRGKVVDGASPFSFQDLGMGYAKDAFNAYYRGKKIHDAGTATFKVLEHGYAEDAFNSYYKGKKVNHYKPLLPPNCFSMHHNHSPKCNFLLILALSVVVQQFCSIFVTH